MEMELQRLQNHLSIMQAALEEAGTRSDDDIIVAQLAREEAERLVLTSEPLRNYHVRGKQSPYIFCIGCLSLESSI